MNMKTGKKRYRPWVRFAILVVRTLQGRKPCVGEVPPGPCVYLVRHRNADGVMDAFTSLPVVMRPLVLSVFDSYQEAKRHLRDYTFSVKMGKGRAFCAVASPIAAFVLSVLAHSARSIPVYRGEHAVKAVRTIRESVHALEDGDNLLIFPDIAYTDLEEKTEGEIYKGFLAIDKLFFRRNGQHISFVPVYIDKKTAVIHPPVNCVSGREEEAYRAIMHGIFNAQ